MIKKIDYRHYICVFITLIFLGFAVFYFQYADNRILESLTDLKNSGIYWVSKLFDLDLHGEITINNFSSCPFDLPLGIPNNWEDFKTLWGKYWRLWVDKDNFFKYINQLANLIYYLSKILILIMPMLLLLFVIKLFIKNDIDNDYNVDSKPLKVFKVLENKLYIPVKKWLIGFWRFIQDNSIYSKLWLFIGLYCFNFISVFISAIAYYLYFVCSFKTITIYIQAIKLLIDLSVLINFIPLVVWLIIGFIVVNKICKKIGYDRLNHFELRDRGFINERPIVIMLCGTMGSKKTTILTDISLSQEIMFRNVAFEKLLKTDLKFPYFPWINLENSLKQAMENHSVYNLATCKRFVNSKRIKFMKHPKKRNIFMYDFEKYAMEYNDSLTIHNIWDIIETYTQLYFIYIIESSLLISNYSIRVDNVLNSVGNFPIWHTDLFRSNPQMQKAYSRHAHILDFDMLRLGKKVIENNKYKDTFEFGIIDITEIGKERQNTLELRELKKNADEANQKNDNFNSWLKLVRHSATVDNFPFVRIFTDDQRCESWGADGRELCEIVEVDKCSEPLFVRPLLGIYEGVCNWLINRFKVKYSAYRYNHGSNSLFMYLYKGFISKVYTFSIRNINTFGYYKLDMIIESGRQDGKLKESTYFLMFKKAYSRRFSTDCFSDFFNEKALCSDFGINDLPEFKTEKASFEEMIQENSYFFNDLLNLELMK